MFHYGCKPNNNIKKDIINIDIFKKSIFNLPEPITQTKIKIGSNYYYDSFEISLLRFIHIIFGEENTINMDKVRYLMGDSYANNELYNFLLQNNKYERRSVSYSKPNFLKQRTEWCKFLNNRPFFQYKFENGTKLCSSIGNFLTFFWYFFSFKYKSSIDNNTLTKLMEFLSVNKKISAKLFKYGYIGRDKSFEELTMKIYINDNNLYDWHMYQYYECNDNTMSPEISGNSELKYSVYLEKFYYSYNDESSIYSDLSTDSECSIETLPNHKI